MLYGLRGSELVLTAMKTPENDARSETAFVMYHLPVEWLLRSTSFRLTSRPAGILSWGSTGLQSSVRIDRSALFGYALPPWSCLLRVTYEVFRSHAAASD
jgi:hypothetical protein